MKNLCRFEMGGLANADVIRGSLNADRGVKFAKILLTSYVNTPLLKHLCATNIQNISIFERKRCAKFIIKDVCIFDYLIFKKILAIQHEQLCARYLCSHSVYMLGQARDDRVILVYNMSSVQCNCIGVKF